jgi:hypothetical protein
MVISWHFNPVVNTMNSILCGSCIVVVILLGCLSMCGNGSVIATLLINSSLFALENSKMSTRTANWCMPILWTWQTLNYKLLSLKQEAGKNAVTIKYKE